MINVNEARAIRAFVTSAHSMLEAETHELSDEDVLYHYTSQQGLLGIVRANNIWASNIQYLNDSREFTHAAEVLLEELEANPTLLDSPVLPDLGIGVRETLARPDVVASEVFVTSFTTNGDQLSQWRGYTRPGNGFSLGFQHGSLKSLGHRLAPCVYDEGKQREMAKSTLRLLAEAVRNTWATTAAMEHPPQDGFHSWAAEVLLGQLAPVFKHHTFGGEQEWRLIVREDHSLSHRASNKPHHPLQFRPGSSFLVPYVELPLHESDSPEKPVRPTACFIGPTALGRHSEHAVAALLREIDVAPEAIQISATSYRGW